MLFITVPALSQFGPIQCRFSEFLVLIVFFRPKFCIGITLGCLLVNITGAATGQNIPLDILIGTMATLIACLLSIFASPFLFIAALYHVVLNGLIVGTEVYFLFNDNNLNIFACMGFVALGELVALTIGYIIFMIIIRNKGAMAVMKPTRHIDVKF